MVPLSILDLAPIVQGGSAADALRNALDLARLGERHGYRRFWMAEHHSMPGVASAATAVALAYVGSGTESIRIGAGGIMLPNHAPLVIAEQFGTLESLYPGRVDLGLGRAPGTDQAAARALRRSMESDPDAFPHDVMELMDYFRAPAADRKVRAIPGEGLAIPIWILGSSLFGAQLAAMLGLPYAFASHFAPTHLMEAIHVYRTSFRPSSQLQSPYVMLGFNVIAAESDAEAEYLATSVQQAFLNLRRGRPTPLPPPESGFKAQLDRPTRFTLEQLLAGSAIGGPETAKAQVEAFVERTGADELIITAQIFDHHKRLKSFEILADLFLAEPPDSRRDAVELASEKSSDHYSRPLTNP